jgi:hypothetical protein
MTPDHHTPLCELAKIRFCELDRRIAERFKSMQLAIDKAEHTINLRMESMNEFRSQIKEERNQYLTRREALLMAMAVIAIMSLMVAWVGLR